MTRTYAGVSDRSAQRSTPTEDLADWKPDPRFNWTSQPPRARVSCINSSFFERSHFGEDNTCRRTPLLTPGADRHATEKPAGGPGRVRRILRPYSALTNTEASDVILQTTFHMPQ